MAKKQRISSISLATKDEESGEYEYDNFGVLLGDSDYPGSASAIIEIDHPTRTETAANGKDYPVRGKLVVCKFLFPAEEGETEAEEAFVDVSESFFNLTFWHAVERSPKAQG
jgi:hypothetical protein